MKTIMILLFHCLIFFGCSQSPVVWETPALELPKASHAYAMDMRRIFKIPKGEQVQWDKWCEQIDKENPERESESELFEEKQMPKPQNKTEEETKTLKQERVLSSFDGIEFEEKNRKHSVHLPPTLYHALGEPWFPPEIKAQPAIVTITLDEIRWLDKPVAQLKEGRLQEDMESISMIPGLYEAVNSDREAAQELSSRCNLWRTIQGESLVLLVIDTRVPVHTVGRVMYSLGQSQFISFAFVVDDASPSKNRSGVPIAGNTDEDDFEGRNNNDVQLLSGRLEIQSTQLDWHQSGEETKKFSRQEKLPHYLGETAPPTVVIPFSSELGFGDFIFGQDQLAGADVFCVSVSLPSNKAVIPLSAPQKNVSKNEAMRSLRLNETSKVAVHLVGQPTFGARVFQRWDGALCSLLKVEMLEQQVKKKSLAKIAEGFASLPKSSDKQTLCSDDETIFFSCELEKKVQGQRTIVSLCGNSEGFETAGLQYRMGTVTAVKTVFPQNNQGSLALFNYEYSSWAKGQRWLVDFKIGEVWHRLAESSGGSGGLPDDGEANNFMGLGLNETDYNSCQKHVVRAMRQLGPWLRLHEKKTDVVKEIK